MVDPIVAIDIYSNPTVLPLKCWPKNSKCEGFVFFCFFCREAMKITPEEHSTFNDESTLGFDVELFTISFYL